MLQPQQKTNNDQDNNNDGEHVDETTCVGDARNDGLTEETEQPVDRQYQDDQLKQGNLLSNQVYWHHPARKSAGWKSYDDACRAREAETSQDGC
jgi:hypothetical protein